MHILRSKVQTLLAKGAVETVPLANSEFLQPILPRSQDSGLRPILDLESRPHVTAIQNVNVETNRCSNMPQGLVSADTYFHIQIAPVTDYS